MNTYDTLTDSTYDRWQVSMTKAEILTTCDYKERIALLICWLDGQVYNGGLMQWDANGYSEFVIQTVDALVRIGKANGGELSAASQVADKLNKVLAEINEIKERYGNDETDDLLCEEPEDFDDFYYSGIGDEVLAETEVWLNSI